MPKNNSARRNNVRRLMAAKSITYTAALRRLAEQHTPRFEDTDFRIASRTERYPSSQHVRVARSQDHVELRASALEGTPAYAATAVRLTVEQFDRYQLGARAGRPENQPLTIATAPDGTYTYRNAEDPASATVSSDQEGFLAFLDGVCRGEFGGPTKGISEGLGSYGGLMRPAANLTAEERAERADAHCAAAGRTRGDVHELYIKSVIHSLALVGITRSSYRINDRHERNDKRTGAIRLVDQFVFEHGRGREVLWHEDFGWYVILDGRITPLPGDPARLAVPDDIARAIASLIEDFTPAWPAEPLWTTPDGYDPEGRSGEWFDNSPAMEQSLATYATHPANTLTPLCEFCLENPAIYVVTVCEPGSIEDRIWCDYCTGDMEFDIQVEMRHRRTLTREDFPPTGIVHGC